MQIFLQYYNSSLERDESTKKVVKFGAVASISGGLKANYSHSAPKIMYYSARGPDPEDSFLDDADILKPNLVAPGNFIWAAWSSLGTDSVEFMGIISTHAENIMHAVVAPEIFFSGVNKNFNSLLTQII